MNQKKIHENNFIYFAKKALGIILIITGFIGLFLPFLQGIVMILLGVALLGGKPAVKRIKFLSKKIHARLKNIWH